MSPKSEENIKRKTNAKVNLKISRKKSKPTTENISYAKISSLKNNVDSRMIKNKNNIVSNEPEKAKGKRVIKNIKKTSTPKVKAINPEPVKEVKEVKIDNKPKVEKISKKTLKLNINRYSDDISEKRIFTPDTSVNQNSSFFYSPSVFQKFGINITDVSNENNEEEINSEDNNLIEEIGEIEKIEVAENINNEENKENLEISEDDITNSISDDELLELLNIEEETETPKEEPINTEKVQEAAGSIIPIEKEDSTINKIKNTVVTGSPTISSVFKTFSYEEANLVNIDKPQISTDTIIENQPAVTSAPIIKVPTIDNTVSADILNNNVSIDMNSIDFDETPIQAVPEANIVESPIPQDVSFEAKSTSLDVNTLVKEQPTNIKKEENIDEPVNPEVSLNMDLDEDLLENLIEEDLTEEDLEKEFSYEDNNENNVEEPIEENIEKINKEEEKVETASDLIAEVLETTPSDDNMFNIEAKDEDTTFSDEDYLKYSNYEDDDNNDDFSIEDYFGLNDIKVEKPKKDITKRKPLLEEIEELEELNENIEEDLKDEKEEEKGKKSIELSESELSSLSQLFDTFTEKISSLSNRISELENSNSTTEPEPSKENEEVDGPNSNYIDNFIEENSIIENFSDNNDQIDKENENIDTKENNEEVIPEEMIPEEIIPEEIIPEEMVPEEIIPEEMVPEEIIDNDITKPINNDDNFDIDIDDISLEDILSQKLSDDNSELDELMKQELLNEVLLSNEEDLIQNNTEKEANTNQEESTDDFFTIIDTLTKTISQLENSGNENQNFVSNSANGKSFNILIDQDDIFSISILNETYEIVADFDGISVLSENIHISTPKKNFYVNIGEKYIEIHNIGTEFTVNTNFEDIEFANALNNITFGKKNNLIELSVKEAFKLSSVNNKVELSMLNTNVADIKKSNVETSETVNEASICDNRTLLISEETQKVYLPYTIEELMQKLNNSHEYQTLEDVIENEYTVPLSTFKMPIISRFKEAYRFMRTKEHSSVYAALDLAIELMFNSNLNPAVIRAAKDLKELNVYLDCLYENEIEKFDCFKIVYKVLPKIQ